MSKLFASVKLHARKFDEGNLLYKPKKVNRNVQGMTQSQTTANPRHQEEEKKDKKHTRAKQTNKCTRSTKTSSLLPKRGDQNANFKTLSAPWYKPQSGYTDL